MQQASVCKDGKAEPEQKAIYSCREASWRFCTDELAFSASGGHASSLEAFHAALLVLQVSLHAANAFSASACLRQGQIPAYSL